MVYYQIYYMIQLACLIVISNVLFNHYQASLIAVVCVYVSMCRDEWIYLVFYIPNNWSYPFVYFITNWCLKCANILLLFSNNGNAQLDMLITRFEYFKKFCQFFHTDIASSFKSVKVSSGGIPLRNVVNYFCSLGRFPTVMGAPLVFYPTVFPRRYFPRHFLKQWTNPNKKNKPTQTKTKPGLL